MSSDNGLDPELARKASVALLCFALFPPAFHFLIPQLLTWKGIIIGLPMILALFAVNRNIPAVDGKYYSGTYLLLRASLFALVTWVIFITLGYLSLIKNFSYWADLVTLKPNIPRGGRSMTAAIAAAFAGVASLPRFADASGPVAGCFKRVISGGSFISGNDIGQYTRERMRGKRDQKSSK